MPTIRFFDMPICNIAYLFDLIDEALTKKKNPWSNVVGFESDTCNVMIGRHNSVLSNKTEAVKSV